MAIQSVSFMGREGCITPAKKTVEKAAEKTAQEAEKFFNGRAPIENVKKVEKIAETVDPGALNSYLESHANIETLTANPSADKIAEAYRAAHGIK
ncbi:hypothetical protein IJ384_01835 [bacterium]|nr:hypothetical protein [bacterium]